MPLVYTPQSAASLGARILETALAIFRELAARDAGSKDALTSSTPSASLPHGREALLQLSPHSILFTADNTLALIYLPPTTPVPTTSDIEGPVAPFSEAVKQWQLATPSSTRKDSTSSLDRVEANCVHAVALIVFEAVMHAFPTSPTSLTTEERSHISSFAPELDTILNHAIAAKGEANGDARTLQAFLEQLRLFAGETDQDEENSTEDNDDQANEDASEEPSADNASSQEEPSLSDHDD